MKESRATVTRISTSVKARGVERGNAKREVRSGVRRAGRGRPARVQRRLRPCSDGQSGMVVGVKGISRRFHVGSGLEEIEVVRRGQVGFGRGNRARWFPGERRRRGCERPGRPGRVVPWARGQRKMRRTSWRLLGQVRRPSGSDWTQHPIGRSVRVVGSVGNDFGGHAIAEGEVLHSRVVLGKLLAGGAAQRADVGHHMVAEKTAAACGKGMYLGVLSRPTMREPLVRAKPGPRQELLGVYPYVRREPVRLAGSG